MYRAKLPGAYPLWRSGAFAFRSQLSRGAYFYTRGRARSWPLGQRIRRTIARARMVVAIGSTGEAEPAEP